MPICSIGMITCWLLYGSEPDSRSKFAFIYAIYVRQSLLSLSGKTIADIYCKQLFQPMNKKMTLSTDRKSASEGEYIEIRWACDACPDSLYLAIDSERTQYCIAVSDSGTTRIPVPKSNGKMIIKLIGVISGKKITESVDVRVKGAKRAKSNTPISGRMKMFGEKMKAKWYAFRAGTDSISDAITKNTGLPEHQSLRH